MLPWGPRHSGHSRSPSLNCHIFPKTQLTSLQADLTSPLLVEQEANWWTISEETQPQLMRTCLHRVPLLNTGLGWVALAHCLTILGGESWQYLTQCTEARVRD